MPELVGAITTKPLWGLEGIHVWDEILPINARDTWPRIKLSSISGLSGLGEGDDVRSPAVGRSGEIPRLSFRRGKTIVYEGTAPAGGVQARTLSDLRDYEATIRAAFYDLQEKKVTVLPHPEHDSGERFFYARAIDLEIPDRPASPFNPHHGHARDFALSLRCSDSRYYDGEEVVATGGANVTFAAFHAGTVPTDPIIEVTGPTTGGAITNTTLNAFLIIDDVPSGQVLAIDFQKRTLMIGATDQRQLLNLGASTWWDSGVWGLAPGDNAISSFLGGTTGATKITVRHHAAYAG